MKENINLSAYTHFKIGGPARYFADASNEKELRESLVFAKSKKLPIVFLGAGSNVLVSSAGFGGVVVRILMRGIKRSGSDIIAGAGIKNAIVVSRAVSEGLSGFEWAIGIPGTIGGSVRGNAGCFSGEMKDVVRNVKYLNVESGEIKNGDNEFCEFAYRNSIFKRRPEYVILEATLALKEGAPETIQKMVRFYSSRRSDTQDIGSASAGCVFKNASWPKGDGKKDAFIERYPELGEFRNRASIPTAYLIDRLGLKGTRIGNVSISGKHANYFINHGNATSDEVIMLMGLVKERTHGKYGIHLEEEIQFIGI